MRTKRDIEEQLGEHAPGASAVRQIDLLAGTGNHIKQSGTARANGSSQVLPLSLAVSTPLAVDGAATPKTVLGPVLLNERGGAPPRTDIVPTTVTPGNQQTTVVRAINQSIGPRWPHYVINHDVMNGDTYLPCACGSASKWPASIQWVDRQSNKLCLGSLIAAYECTLHRPRMHNPAL